MTKPATTTKEEVKVTKPAKGKGLIERYGSKSAAIRALNAQGMGNGEIVKVFQSEGLKMRYQHVYNVLHTVVKKPAAKTESKKA